MKNPKKFVKLLVSIIRSSIRNDACITICLIFVNAIGNAWLGIQSMLQQPRKHPYKKALRYYCELAVTGTSKRPDSIHA